MSCSELTIELVFLISTRQVLDHAFISRVCIFTIINYSKDLSAGQQSGRSCTAQEGLHKLERFPPYEEVQPTLTHSVEGIQMHGPAQLAAQQYPKVFVARKPEIWNRHPLPEMHKYLFSFRDVEFQMALVA